MFIEEFVVVFAAWGGGGGLEAWWSWEHQNDQMFWSLRLIF